MAAQHPAAGPGRAAGVDDSTDPASGGGQSGAGDRDFLRRRLLRRTNLYVPAGLGQRSELAEGIDLGWCAAVVATIPDCRVSQAQGAIDVARGNGREA
ncbi:hypothetical protein D3C81_1025390 [compost metagenome]